MEIWQLAAWSVLGYLIVGCVVDFYTTAADDHWEGWKSTTSEQFFCDTIKDVRWHPGAHVGMVLLWFPIFLFFLYWFLKGGVRVALSGRKRERAT